MIPSNCFAYPNNMIQLGQTMTAESIRQNKYDQLDAKEANNVKINPN
jgi:hypothetical protein